MYILTLKDDQGKKIYFYRRKDDKVQIYTFESPQSAQKCLQLFQDYSINRFMQETNDIFGFGKVIMTCSSFEIEPLSDNIAAETVSFEEVMKEKGCAI